jgi:uncharacterized membrane protein
MKQATAFPGQSRAVQSNIEAIVRLEEEAERDRSALERFPETIGRFAGTLSFVAFQVVFLVAYVAANGGMIPGVEPWDPYPYSLLSGFFSLEGVLLTAFVLIRQNRMNRKADRRNHLDLQINLLSEKEITKVIQMLERLSNRLGIQHEVVDPEAEELSEITAVEGLARQLDSKLDPDDEA